MKPQDHSDTTLLVWSDWLEENDEEQKAHELREEIANPHAEKWSYQYRYRSRGNYVGGGDDRVGSIATGEDVGVGGVNGVGGDGENVGGVIMDVGGGLASNSECVGGLGRA